jgi:hypothetical protein
MLWRLRLNLGHRLSNQLSAKLCGATTNYSFCRAILDWPNTR